jgi:drug/metabolite transporter (DMT)-like permease
MRARFWIWVACVVVFAYLPLWYALAYDYIHSTKEVIDELIGKGDLALIASAIMADGFGRVLLRIKSDQERPSGYVLGMLIWSFLVIVGCLILYAAGRGPKPSLHEMKSLTVVVAAITTATSGSVILFIEAENE